MTECIVDTRNVLQKDFYNVYAQIWKDVSIDLCININDAVTNLVEENGEALQESWNLDGVRWGYEPTNIEMEVLMTNEWFSGKVNWLNNQLQYSEE